MVASEVVGIHEILLSKEGDKDSDEKGSDDFWVVKANPRLRKCVETSSF